MKHEEVQSIIIDGVLLKHWVLAKAFPFSWMAQDVPNSILLVAKTFRPSKQSPSRMYRLAIPVHRKHELR
jgi:hypothetical protein